MVSLEFLTDSCREQSLVVLALARDHARVGLSQLSGSSVLCVDFLAKLVLVFIELNAKYFGGGAIH